MTEIQTLTLGVNPIISIDIDMGSGHIVGCMSTETFILEWEGTLFQVIQTLPFSSIEEVKLFKDDEYVYFTATRNSYFYIYYRNLPEGWGTFTILQTFTDQLNAVPIAVSISSNNRFLSFVCYSTSGGGTYYLHIYLNINASTSTVYVD